MNHDGKLCAHYLNLQYSENFFSDFDKKLFIQLPHPLHKPLQIDKIDLIDKLNRDLEFYNNEVAATSKDFDLVKNQLLNQSFTNSHGTVTKRILNICNSKKPETPFSCDYNPYYTGYLTHFELNGKEYLVRPDCKNNLRLTNLKKPWKSQKLQVATSFEDPITGLSSYSSNNICLLVKGKNDTNLLEVSDTEDLVSIIYYKKFKQEVLDTKLNKSQVGYVLSDLKFRLYDLETEKKISLLEFDNSKFIRCDFMNNSVILLSQKKCSLVDLRSADKLLFAPALENCDNLTCVKIYNNFMYVASRHYLLRTDIRFLKQEEFCNHLMKSSPCFITVADDMLCLSSQKFEKVLFFGNPISSLPVEIPDISDTLYSCKSCKDVLLKPHIDDHLKVSIGGMKLISNSNGINLYTANAFGEIFRQKIADHPNFEDDNAIEELLNWINYIKPTFKDLHLTNVAHVNETAFCCKATAENIKTESLSKKTRKLQFFKNRFKNRYSKENSAELITNFVSIWAEGEEEEREKVDLVPEVAPLDKVTDWIESQYFFD